MLPLLMALSTILPVLLCHSVYIRSMEACLHPPEICSPPSVKPQGGHCMVLLCWHLYAILLLHSVPNLQFSAVLRAACVIAAWVRKLALMVVSAMGLILCQDW